MLEDEAVEEHAESGAATGDAAPHGDGLGPLVSREDVGQDRQRRGHDHRPGQAHDAPGGDEGAGGTGEEGGVARGQPEEEEAGLHDALAAEAVADGAGGEEQAGEDQGVGVDDPLHGRRRQADAPGDLGQGQVEGGVALHDQQQAGAEHAEDDPAARVGILVQTGGERGRVHVPEYRH